MADKEWDTLALQARHSRGLNSNPNFLKVADLMHLRQVVPADLPAILKIEHAGFTAAEAGTPEAYAARIQAFPATFLVAEERNTLLGFVCGPIVADDLVADWMYDQAPTNLPTGGHQMILTIAVAPAAQGRGIGSRLLRAFAESATAHHCQSIALTCLADRIPFYQKNGYQVVGVSTSQHAGETWYDLVKEL